MRRKHHIGLFVAGLLFVGGLLVSVQKNEFPHPPLPNPPELGWAGDIGGDASDNLRTGADRLAQSAQNASANQEISNSKVAVSRKQQAKQEKYVTIDNKVYPLRIYKPAAMPNDPYANQWSVTNAKLPEAWEVPRGNHQTVLAIIDTGFGLQHEEFTNRWYDNSGESGSASSENPSSLNCSDRSLALNASCNLIDDNGDAIIDNEIGAVSYENPSRLNCTDQSKPLAKDCNRIDDDGNGYVDDVRGWDFVNYDNSAQAGELNPYGDGVTHGTLVAGVAAATGNNSKGVAGVDWGTKILPIQALDDDSYGDTRSVGRAIRYAVARGADVISLSLGSDLPDAYVEEAVQIAAEAGVVVVAAAGNDGCDCMLYPANYPEAVAVGALNQSSQRASFSSYGQNLDVMAPGTGITSSTWSAANQTSAYASGANGTSFATPMISGMMTRLLSHQPTATPSQLTSSITENTNRLGMAVTMPLSTKLGFGALDAQKATSRMTTARSVTQLYGFLDISHGNYISPVQPTEPAGSYFVQECESGNHGSTVIYDLTKGNDRFFTISKIEQKKAVTLGYSSRLLAYACLSQPHDTPQSVRDLNTKLEF